MSTSFFFLQSSINLYEKGKNYSHRKLSWKSRNGSRASCTEHVAVQNYPTHVDVHVLWMT